MVLVLADGSFGSWNAESSYWQGDFVYQSGRFDVLQLFRRQGIWSSCTFQYGSGSPDDGVDDTPAQAMWIPPSPSAGTLYEYRSIEPYELF